MYDKLIKTPSMIVEPSTILLQPLVGGFHASDQEKSETLRSGKISIFCQLSDKFGHQVVVCHHAGATIVVVWHCMDV